MTTDTIAAPVRARIDATLDRIEREHDVRILLAVESGSRAWGFASPDSDYDVRFLYVRPLDWYLSLSRGRDVIELPIEDDLDVNGWDVAKALPLLCKANPVLFEWLASPVVYRADGAAVAAIRALSDSIGPRNAAVHHYQQLARSSFERHIEGREAVRLKKYFYALRPACALVWLRTRPGERLPMALGELLAGILLPEAVRDAMDGLLAQKTAVSEMGEGPRHADLDAFVRAEIEIAAVDGQPPVPDEDGITTAADLLFRRLVTGAGEA